MTSGMMAGRGFFPPGKGGRRGFPLIGEDFGYFGPHDKPPFPHDFGYPPNFPPGPPDGFFPGNMGFMGKILFCADDDKCNALSLNCRRSPA